MQKQDQLKQKASEQAINYILPLLNQDTVIGVGTGSTVNFFIDMLALHKHKFMAAVSSSERSTQRMLQHGIKVIDLNEVHQIAVYVDGADEINPDLIMIKGGGGALTREKIVASVAQKFVCIADDSKLVKTLGKFPLPVEVIPLARNAVARRLQQLGGTPEWREGYVTDNGGHILDVAGLAVSSEQAINLETSINSMPGVISCGFFALNPASVAIIAGAQGVQVLE